MKLALEILMGIAVYITGSSIFLRVWCYRFGEHLESKPAEYGLKLTGYYVRGWADGPNPYYSLGSAKLVSFFCWIPLSIFIFLRETIIIVAKSIGRVQHIFLPPEVIKKPLQPIEDRYLIAAEREVESIISE